VEISKIAKSKSKRIETQKHVEYMICWFIKTVQYFIQTDDNIVPDANTPLPVMPTNQPIWSSGG
jgi:hypothetical protein